MKKNGHVEIERKFLVKKAPGDLASHPHTAIDHAYLATAEDGLQVRIRRQASRCFLTIKGGDGASRTEEEVEITPEQFESLWPLARQGRLSKVRYETSHGKAAVVVDVYQGKLQGLTLAEVEFRNQRDAARFRPPEWLGRDVTTDERYQNRVLGREGAPPEESAPATNARRSFELRADESLAKNTRRIARKQLRNGAEDLTGSSGLKSEQAVHKVRRRLKRVRTLLRLARPALSARSYRKENAALRDLARPLSEVRDAAALISALDKLRAASRGMSAPFKPIRSWLKKRQAEIASGLQERGELDHVARALKKAARRSRDWSLGGGDWRIARAGLCRVYGAGRRAMRAAADRADDDNLHEWRKQAKYLRHVLELLDPLGDGTLTRARETAHDLGDHLGEDHDLAVLAKLLKERDEKAVAPITAAIERHRSELQREAFLLGEELYRRRPAIFVSQLCPFYETWRASAKS